MEWASTLIKFSSYLYKPVLHLLSSISRKKKYSPEQTKQNIEVSISARDGSLEIYCDKEQAMFNVILEFRNSNPFWIEIDRVELSGRLYTASVNAVELCGKKIDANKKVDFYIKSRIDETNLEKIRKVSNNETLDLYVKAVIVNKHYTIRDFGQRLERLRCKYTNQNVV